MTPGAQIEAAIGLLDQIDRDGAPADDIVANYFRRHRFAGSKDRGAISEHIYAVLRQRAALDWWIARAQGLPTDSRRRMLAALALVEGWEPAAIAKACDGDRFRPTPLSREEERLLAALAGHKLEHRDMPPEVRGNYPPWLHPHLDAVFGRGVVREGAALFHEGVEAARTPLSPLGLRVFARIPLATLAAFRDGLVEVQDEGSRIAALLADARPGM